MDLIKSLLEAQKGNYQAYESIINELKNSPASISYLIHSLGETRDQSEKELIGLFIKNILKHQFFSDWWLSVDREPLVHFLLKTEGILKFSSLILAMMLEIETNKGDNFTLNILMASNTKPSILSIGYYVENSRTIPQVLGNYISSLVPSLLNTDSLLGLSFFQKTANHIMPNSSVIDTINLICSLTASSDKNIAIEAYQCLVDVISQFYDYLHASFDRIYRIALDGLNSEDDDVVQPSLECWNVLCDLETKKKNEKTHSFGYVFQVSEEVLKTLIEKISRSENAPNKP